MRKAEMMGFAEIVRQETKMKQRMIVEHGQELAAHVKRLEEVGAVLIRKTPTETVYDAARRVMMELARLKNTSVFVEKLSAVDAEEQQNALRVKLQQAQVEATHATTKLNIVSKAYDEALALCHEDEGKNPAEQIKFLRVEVDTLNVELENSRQAIATWSQSTEKVLHRLGSKQGESIDEALNRWLSEHMKNLQANRNTLRLYEAAMELCEGGMVPSEQIIKLRGLVNTLQQQLADTAERAAIGQLVVAPRDQLIENDELRNANTKLREEVAALQEKWRASIQRADFAQIEVDRLKAQSATTPKSESTTRNHPVSVGEWVAKDWKQAAQVVEVDVEGSQYGIRFLGSKVVEVWSFGHCKPCNPPTLEALQAHHDRVVEHMQDEATRLSQLLTESEAESRAYFEELEKARRNACLPGETLNDAITRADRDLDTAREQRDQLRVERDSLRDEVTLLRAELDTEKSARKVDVAELGFELGQRKGETLLAAARRVCNAEVERLKGECVVLRLEVLELKGISKHYKESLLQKHGEIEAIAKALGEHEGQTDEEAVLALVAERDSLLTARHTGWVRMKESNQTPRHGEPAQILAFIVHYEGSERRWDATLCEPCAPPDETEVTVPGPDAL